MQMAHISYITLETMHLERLVAQKCIATGIYSRRTPDDAILKQRHTETMTMNSKK